MAKLKALLAISLVLNLVLAIWFATYSSRQDEIKDVLATTERKSFIDFKMRVYSVLETGDRRHMKELMDECEFNAPEDGPILDHFEELVRQGKIKRQEVIRTPGGGGQPPE